MSKTFSIKRNLANQETVDVLIMGGGPAGIAAGLALLKRGNLNVLVIERGDYSEYKYGESLASTARATLEYLGVWQEFSEMQAQEIFDSQVAWGSDSLRSLGHMFTPHGSGWALDRLSFEKMLAKNFVSRGGDLLTQHQVITCEALPKGGWKVLIKSAENEVRTIYAKYVIDASGRRGVMRTNLNLPLTVHDRLVGIGCVGSIAEDSYIEFTNQVEACEYGWWYITPLEDNRVSVVLMSDPDIINKMHISQLTVWRDLLANMPHSGLKMQQVFFAEQPRSFPCFSSFLPEAGGVDWVAIGDAVASYDPISSSGIPRAIASGIHGALVAIDSLQGNGGMLNLYAQTIQQDFAQYLQTQWQSYQREARWLDAPFWARRRAVIAISAESSVKATRFYDARSSFEPIHLKSNELHALWSLCSAGKNLREIITQFMRQHRHIPEQKIMLGLQELIARDYLDISAEEDEDCVFFNTERLVFD